MKVEVLEEKIDQRSVAPSTNSSLVDELEMQLNI